MTCFSSLPNIYKILDEEEDKETNEPMRKAKKKLREIEKLKQKEERGCQMT